MMFASIARAQTKVAAAQTPVARAQTPTDDPAAARNSVTYMHSDFMHGVARIFDLDSTPRRFRRSWLPAGDVRFGVAPSIAVAPHIALQAEAGVAARFLLDRSHLAASDWHAAALAVAGIDLPARMARILCDARAACVLHVSAGARHVSSHGGDELMQSESTPFRIYSRDGIVVRIDAEVAHAGGRVEIDDEYRSYGVEAATASLAELWLRPSLHSRARFGAVYCEMPGADEPYESAYIAIPVSMLSEQWEIRGRFTRGAMPIGYLFGALEKTAQIEIVIR